MGEAKGKWLLAGCLYLGLVLWPLQQRALAAQELLLFGNEDGKDFIGCLNCGPYDVDSVCYPYGEYGSTYGSKSIWNAFGEYGSRNSNLSPWNVIAFAPPVIADRGGNFYGYLTANRSLLDRTTLETLAYLVDNVDVLGLSGARARLCD